jgi:anthranilate/para-aminobenzoate synthase component I
MRGLLSYRKQRLGVSLDNLVRLTAQRPNPAILGANSAASWSGRYSIFASDPIEILDVPLSAADPLSMLGDSLDRYRLDDSDSSPLPEGIFRGGWIGFFSYDLCRHFERIDITPAIRDDLRSPLIRLCLYDRAIVIDHADAAIWLIAVSFSNDSVSSDGKLDGLEDILKHADDLPACSMPEFDANRLDAWPIQSRMTRSYYDQSLRKIHRYILDGECYQINYSRQFVCPFPADPVDLFRWQNQFNPSPLAAYLDAGEYSIVSTSPEMFLTIHNDEVSTQPIKGTRPRSVGGVDAERFNRSQFQDLLGSEKEQAELNMIIDLERNDLHRICRPGTVSVSQPRTIEPYPTLFHAVATVRGSLRRPLSTCGLAAFCDILRAVFPGGSITGAPKIRAMQIIEELEPLRRGLYTGSIGYLGLDGSVCLNIAIRTCMIKDGLAYLNTGGGIVAESEIDAEWDETLVKARAMLAGLSAVNDLRSSDRSIKTGKTGLL